MTKRPASRQPGATCPAHEEDQDKGDQPRPGWRASWAGTLFLLRGALWGLLFAPAVSDPIPRKGVPFGIAPAFWPVLVVAPLMLNAPVFFGFAAADIILPFVLTGLV